MNPFTLPGPDFLVFYALFAAAVVLLLFFSRRTRERGPLPKVDPKDPYLFACLSGGPVEVVRVCTVGLVDRGLLQLSGGTAQTVSDAVPAFGGPLIERLVLDYFRGGASLSSAGRNRDLLAAASTDYESHLRGAGLLPNAEAQHARRSARVLAITALAGVGGIKILVALAAGRSNIGLLILLMTLVIVIAIANSMWDPYRTALGDTYLASVRSLFAGLRERSALLQPGSGTRELLWLTALFGTAMLPTTLFPAVAHAWADPSGRRGSGCGGGGGCGSGSGGGGCGGCGGGGGCGG